MIVQCESLEEALGEIEAGRLGGASTIVVNLRRWEALSEHERDAYRGRADRAGVELRVDSAISPHFVEVRGGDEGPPLSSEHPT